ncbi:MAG: DUF1638 domain-containing protein [Planctomycetota bacterium]
MRLKLIACEILYREFCAAVSRSPNHVDITFLSKGLHDIGQAGMMAQLTRAIAEMDFEAYDAVLLGYALCSNGIVGLTAPSVPLVIPRAHDCITLFLGDRQRYLDYFSAHPGYYYKTSGWIERGQDLVLSPAGSVSGGLTATNDYEALVAKYGEDNARYLMEELSGLTKHYAGLAYIAMGVGPDDVFERQTRELAASRGWEFERLEGDMSLIQGLVDGPWDEARYLVVLPGQSVTPSYDEQIIQLTKVLENPTP